MDADSDEGEGEDEAPPLEANLLKDLDFDVSPLAKFCTPNVFAKMFFYFPPPD